MSDLETIKEEVKLLYEFRDNFFQDHGPENASKKNDEVNQKMFEVVKHIDSFKDSIPGSRRGEYCFLKGRTLNVTSDYNKEAEEYLGRATKFNYPTAWNELGECLFKKGDLTSARTCFQKALDLEKDPACLRNMSMLMRTLPCNDEKERDENVRKGLEYAREAIQLNFSDGHSWLVLGNSYLSLFFTVEAKPEFLKNAKSAYSKAEEDPKAEHLPELHYSKFQVEWYEEDYEGALRSMKRATELEPTWKEAKAKLEECMSFLSRLSHLVRTRGQMSQRKIAALLSGLNDSYLGPYENGGTSLTGNVMPLCVPLSLLAEGINENKIVLGQVVCTVVPDSGLPFAFCFVDKDGTCRGVTVYHWGSAYGVKIGDSVAIVAPVLKKHRFQTEEIEDFSSLRVSLPLMLVVNKRCVNASQISVSTVVSYKKDD